MTVADYANADPAVVKSGRVKKAVANAVEKEGKVYGSALRSLDRKKKLAPYFVIMRSGSYNYEKRSRMNLHEFISMKHPVLTIHSIFQFLKLRR